MNGAMLFECRRPPWVLVSAGFHEQGGQSKANAALADFLLDRGTPVHLVGHDFDQRFLHDDSCTIHPVSRPRQSDFLGLFGLRWRGRRVAQEVCAAHPGTRVVVNGGCCHWADINWVHYVHSAWRPALPGAPLGSRAKETVAGFLFRRQERAAFCVARVVLANSDQTRQILTDQLGVEPAKVHTIYLGSNPSWQPASPAERAAARARLGR
jgi:hypothetical protein